LPDATAVRLLGIPDSAPPYDDEAAGTGQDAADTGEAARRNRALAPPPAGPPGRPAGRGPATSPAADRADRAARWPSQFAQVLAETLAGARPPQQIMPWTTHQARKRIRQLGPLLAAGDLPRVRRVVTSSPAADVIEMTVIIRSGPRFRALAVRLERDGPRGASPGRRARPTRWVCTALETA
jgi:Family of unknown function (DUF6459)